MSIRSPAIFHSASPTVLLAVEDRDRESHLQPGQHQVPVEGVDVGITDQDAVAVGVDLVSGVVGDHHHVPVVAVGAERRDQDVELVDRVGAFLGGVRVDGGQPQEALREAVLLA